MKTIPRVVLGAFAPKINEQIKAPGMTAGWQAKTDAITLLYLHGYITDKQKHALSQRLLREIKEYFIKRAASSEVKHRK